MKRLAVILLVLVAVGGAALGYVRYRDQNGNGLRIETAAATVGEVRRVVSTTGKVRALVTVDVGSQLSGQVADLSADFNSVVAEGQVIARIDPKTFETRVSEAEAAVSVAEAGVAVQAATIERVRASLRQAERDYRRTESLAGRGAVSTAALDDAQARLDTARADLAVAEAQHANARATLRQRQAALSSARIDLERTYIRSPVDGVVINRNVSLGQTVAASLSSPILFTIAQDLRRVQIDAQVDEADIGQVEEGQPVSFRVDSFPEHRFEGDVEQIRLAALEEQNVVTYTVVISADNPQRLLLPGMTANVDIVTGSREGVLTVPNAALRFRPTGAAAALVRGGDGPGGGATALDWLAEPLQMTPRQLEQVRERMRGALAAMREGAATGEIGVARDAIRQRFAKAMNDVLDDEQRRQYAAIQARHAGVRFGTLWVREPGGALAPRRVRLGISDSQVTEVEGDGLQPGEQVVVRARAAAG